MASSDERRRQVHAAAHPSGALEPTTGSVTMGADDRMSVLEQDHFKYDAYNVMDTVIMGNRRLYDIMKEKEALYAKEDFTDADGEKAAELEGEFAEMNGWEAETGGGPAFERFGHSDGPAYPRPCRRWTAARR